jgi:signal transduction histidine kinase
MQQTSPRTVPENKKGQTTSLESESNNEIALDNVESVKDEFISIVSHELRTPMSTIKETPDQ